MKQAAMIASSRRMRSIAGTSQSNPKMWSDRLPNVDRMPTHGPPSWRGTNQTATMHHTATRKPRAGAGMNRGIANPPSCQVTSPARPS